jgi:glycosyltransferase involved in cell wall biosynthesis
MKIAFVNDTFLEGRGADTLIYELAKRIGKKHEVYVLAGETNFRGENFKIIKIKLEKLYAGKLSDFNYFGKLKALREQILQIQNQYHFDVFNVYHIGLNSAFRGLPTIVTWLGSPPTLNPFRKLISNSWIKTLKRNKETIVISNYLKKQLDKRGIKSKTIYCGVSSDFKPSRKDKEYMLYVGRLEKHKNITEIIKLSKEANFKLKIAGYGPEEARLKGLVMPIRAPVEFLGRVSREKLVSLYQECSFFISASKWEGFGLIFLEAAACGKPSIAYNAGSISEVILNDRTGFLVDNYKDFKNRVNLLIKDKNLRKKLGKNALKDSKSFKWEEIAK